MLAAQRLQRLAAAFNHRILRLHESVLPQQASRSRRTKGEKGQAAYLFGVSFSSVKRARGWSLPVSTQGEHNRRVEMMVVALLYRANLPRTVKPSPWHLRVNGSPKVPEELQLLLLSEHVLASGGTLKLKDEFGFLTPELLLDLLGHPIEPCCEFFLVST